MMTVNRLTGKFVFSGKNYKEILNKNTECIVPYPPQYWAKLSPEARDLAQGMLQKDPSSRLSAVEALQHPWFSLNAPLPLQVPHFEDAGDANLTDEYAHTDLPFLENRLWQIR